MFQRIVVYICPFCDKVHTVHCENSDVFIELVTALTLSNIEYDIVRYYGMGEKTC